MCAEALNIPFNNDQISYILYFTYFLIADKESRGVFYITFIISVPF